MRPGSNWGRATGVNENESRAHGRGLICGGGRTKYLIERGLDKKPGKLGGVQFGDAQCSVKKRKGERIQEGGGISKKIFYRGLIGEKKKKKIIAQKRE